MCCFLTSTPRPSLEDHIVKYGFDFEKVPKPNDLEFLGYQQEFYKTKETNSLWRVNGFVFTNKTNNKKFYINWAIEAENEDIEIKYEGISWYLNKDKNYYEPSKYVVNELKNK